MEPTNADNDTPKNLPAGKVGFFWIVPDRLGQDAIFGDCIELATAEVYGEALTHPGGHYDFWNDMKARGPAWLRARNLSGGLLATEYEDWPRGRLVFYAAQNGFTLYSDRRILTPLRLALVRSMFQVSEHRVDLKSDSHYVPAGP
ncbi:MAG: hypothetical protein E5X67_34395 [Mesorhizobium sp.]|uniref:hypothetical protein n=1 Tax=Mesorhizobium sp. TaxID=1871066 RepID=UPI001222CF6F|nr:hypothetical protein [Mesorhizobium sp.]TIP23203.1 MAG: hypothetical protein E5X67_34395 [Mesorhizobium sp.]